jgi:glucokinase
MTHAVGIDLGGTNIKAVIVDGSGRVLDRRTRETNDRTDSIADWAGFIRATIAEFENSVSTKVAHVGLSAPGVPSTDGRCIEFCPDKVIGLERFDWTNALQRDRVVPVLNDAKAALLAEAWTGAARNFPNAILLTLGTGVGGAVLCNGKLFMGAHGRAGHLGHISLDPFGPKSIIESPGALEMWIGNHNIAARIGGRFHSTHELVEAVGRSDAEAIAAWRKSIRALAAGIVSLVHAFDPDAIIIGGGIARAGADLFDPLNAELDEIEWRPTGQRVPIIPAALGEWAGAIGSAYHAMNL